MSKLHDIFDIQKRSGYVFNKWIFRIAFILIAIFLIGVFYLDDFGFKQHVYVKCLNGMEYCANPFYEKCDELSMSWQMTWLKQNKRATYDSMMSELQEVCKIPEIHLSYGQPQPFYLTYSYTIVFLMIIAALVVNHLMYNRAWRMKDEENDDNNNENN